MKKNLDTPVIVVDLESLRPMAWDGNKFVFVNRVSLDSTKTLKRPLRVKAYKRCDAKILVKSDYSFRKKNNLGDHTLVFMLADSYSKAGWKV